MSPLLALLFDLDGTLADTASINTAAYLAALAEAGLSVDPEHFNVIAHGRHWRQFLPDLIGPERRDIDAASVAQRKQALYAETVGAIALNHSLLQLLAATRATLRSALVTTASRVNVDALLAAHALRGHFDAIVTGDDVCRHKPDPEAYLLAARRLGISPANCLAFEDSDIGIQSAVAAGIPVLRVSFPGGSQQPFEHGP